MDIQAFPVTNVPPDERISSFRLSAQTAAEERFLAHLLGACEDRNGSIVAKTKKGGKTIWYPNRKRVPKR